MADWKIGDVVVLRSGSPYMTVMGVGTYRNLGPGENNGVVCVWFDGANRKEDVFHKDSIEAADMSGGAELTIG